MKPTRGPVEVQIKPVRDPEGTPRVLLQLPHAYVLLKPSDARRVAAVMMEAADDIERA